MWAVTEVYGSLMLKAADLIVLFKCTLNVSFLVISGISGISDTVTDMSIRVHGTSVQTVLILRTAEICRGVDFRFVPIFIRQCICSLINSNTKNVRCLELRIVCCLQMSAFLNKLDALCSKDGETPSVRICPLKGSRSKAPALVLTAAGKFEMFALTSRL
jgi:hypothetical protein